jgi:hypothetical protein
LRILGQDVKLNSLAGVPGPDSARVYEFHPWEKNLADSEPYVASFAI